MLKKSVTLLLTFAFFLCFSSCTSSSSLDDNTNNNVNNGIGNDAGNVGNSGDVGDTDTDVKYSLDDFKDYNPSENFDCDDDEVKVFFFDIDNLSNGDSEPVRTYDNGNATTVNACDCYMIKVGNIEILVDAGTQFVPPAPFTKNSAPYEFHYEPVKNTANKNLLKKISSVCTDGVLDYLIVTHSDYDHISALVVEDGIIDAFIKNDTITNINGTQVTLKGITNVVDYNSGIVSLHSYEEISSGSRLCSILYQTYLQKMSLLIGKGTNYLPAASLFDECIVAADGSSMTLENKLLATPQKHIKALESFDSLILTENQPNDAASDFVKKTPKNSDYKENVIKLSGALNVQNGRYYFSIPLGEDAELRILYNWFYDFSKRQSFNSQSINNLSVCIQVVCDDFKFLSLGDLSGDGENGLLNYYNGTDILSNVTLFKASHHASVNNNENSVELYKKTLPECIIITGCAQSPLEPKNNHAAYLQQGFLNNLKTAYQEGLADYAPFIMCTNVNWVRFDEVRGILYHESKPFYGDITIMYDGSMSATYSYTGSIHAFVKTQFEGDTIDFKTTVDDEPLSLQDTPWFTAVGLK